MRFIEPLAATPRRWASTRCRSRPRAARSSGARTGQPAATAAFGSHRSGSRARPASCIYQALYDGDPPRRSAAQARPRRRSSSRCAWTQLLGSADATTTRRPELVHRRHGPGRRARGWPGRRAARRHGSASPHGAGAAVCGSAVAAAHRCAAPTRAEARHANAWLFSGRPAGASHAGGIAADGDGPRTAHRSRGDAAHRRTAGRSGRAPANAEAALRDSEQRFANILDTVPIGIIYTDLRGNIIQANPRFCELTGYSEAELLDDERAEYTHPDDAAGRRSSRRAGARRQSRSTAAKSAT